jgi:hypothetical protein
MNAKEYAELSARAAELAKKMVPGNENLEDRRKMIQYTLSTASRLAREAAEWLVRNEEKTKGVGG